MKVFQRLLLQHSYVLAIVVATLVALAFTLSSDSEAACRCVFVNGQQQQLCDSTIDLPAICAPAIAPIVPPSIAPIQSPTLPPLGTTSCGQAQVWNGYQYVWQTVCQ